jgi:hypothetical protein
MKSSSCPSPTRSDRVFRKYALFNFSAKYFEIATPSYPRLGPPTTLSTSSAVPGSPEGDVYRHFAANRDWGEER